MKPFHTNSISRRFVRRIIKSVRETPVALFFLAAGLPFVVSFALFAVSQRQSFLTEPEAYIALLKRAGFASYTISLSTWKYFLARDSLCREAQAVVIGSSRVDEIDETVVGTSVCNLYVNSLSAPSFAHLAENLPPNESGQYRVVYAGVDHFWFWTDADLFDSLEIKLLSRSRMLWKAWAVIKLLDFFTLNDLHEALRRFRQGHARFEDEPTVWYPDGHKFHPRYYTRKRAGIVKSFSQEEVDHYVDALFREGRLRESNLRALGDGIRVLHRKGYSVQMFWNPVSHAHMASARSRFPILFEETIDAVDRLAATLPLERYIPASHTLDSSRFGCTERDYPDPWHIDVDCTRRMFAATFGGDLTEAVALGGTPGVGASSLLR